MSAVVAIFVGGGLGSLARYGMGKALEGWESAFPLATLFSNLLACLVLGFVMGLASQRPNFSPTLRLGLTTGFCGGFSTFSTFGLESMGMLGEGKWLLGGSYVAASVLLCFAGIWLGQSIAKG